MDYARIRLAVAGAIGAAVLVTGLAVTPPARGAITATTITTPADPSFFIADTDYGYPTLAISGTTTGGNPATDHLDIRCYYGPGTDNYNDVVDSVPLNFDGSFLAYAPLSYISGTPDHQVCRLRAVPAGSSPSDLAPFAGPRVGVGWRATSKLPSGVDLSYDLFGQQLTGAFDYESLGTGFALDEGYLYDSTFALTAYTFNGNADLPPDTTRSDLQIDGKNAYAPYQAYVTNPSGSGVPPMNYSYTLDAHTGNVVIHESEPFVECPDPTYPPNATSCPSFVSAGVTDDRTITQDHDGHVAWITDVFKSTDGHAHALDLLWKNAQYFQNGSGDSSQLEYEFPGQSSYSMHAVNDAVSLPASAPGTILVRMHGAADGDTATGRGAIVYDRPAGTATFTIVASYGSYFTLHQTGTVPTGGSTRFRFAYVQDFHAANVASLAQTATTAFLNTLTVTKPGPGSGTVTSSPAGISCGSTCTHGYSYGTHVTLSETPSAGSAFVGWSGACTGTGSCSVSMTAAHSVTATFKLLPETLTIVKKGDGKGTITSSPAGISCGGTCSHAYDYGSSVVLSAQAAKGSSLLRWLGACTGKATCTVAMKTAQSVTAVFGKDCVVPKVTGKSLKAAKRAIKSHDCSVGRVTHAASSSVKKGEVISQKPKPHRRLKHGAKVDLVVSTG